jgi:hypothetical protein
MRMISQRYARLWAISLCLAWSGLTTLAQTPRPAFKRTADGKPDLNGVWQAMNTANWDLLAHGSAPGPVSSLGAIGAVPPGEGVVEGGAIPYLPAAAAKKNQNFARRWTDDPELKCYMPGVPRATYMPYPFQIVQGAKTILFTYSYAGAVRTIRMGITEKAPVDSWMGWSVGRWEGDTLVVDVTGFNDQTWFDRAGDFHSDKLHVVERYTPRGADVMDYEATIEDADVFSKPWKISMPLYRHLEKNAHLLEFQCIEYSEEILYGHLRHGKGDTK